MPCESRVTVWLHCGDGRTQPVLYPLLFSPRQSREDLLLRRLRLQPLGEFRDAVVIRTEKSPQPLFLHGARDAGAHGVLPALSEHTSELARDHEAFDQFPLAIIEPD